SLVAPRAPRGHTILVAGGVAGLVAGLALVAVARLADLLVDRLLDGLVAGTPALFHHRVVNQLVARLQLVTCGGEAALRVATGLRTTTVAGGATVRRAGTLHG